MGRGLKLKLVFQLYFSKFICIETFLKLTIFCIDVACKDKLQIVHHSGLMHFACTCDRRHAFHVEFLARDTVVSETEARSIPRTLHQKDMFTIWHESLELSVFSNLFRNIRMQVKALFWR